VPPLKCSQMLRQLWWPILVELGSHPYHRVHSCTEKIKLRREKKTQHGIQGSGKEKTWGKCYYKLRKCPKRKKKYKQSSKLNPTQPLTSLNRTQPHTKTSTSRWQLGRYITSKLSFCITNFKEKKKSWFKTKWCSRIGIMHEVLIHERNFRNILHNKCKIKATNTCLNQSINQLPFKIMVIQDGVITTSTVQGQP
jgi:hypothetical protein